LVVSRNNIEMTQKGLVILQLPYSKRNPGPMVASGDELGLD
jgi:hypothetical protein